MGRLDDEATQFALRAALLRDREQGESLELKSILEDAQKYSEEFSRSGNLKCILSEISDSQSIQEAAIKTAFKGLEYVYTRISEENHTTQEKNDDFEHEVELGFASFSVPLRGALSAEERSMKAFYELAKKAEKSWLIRYLGITKKESKELTGKTYYRVLPLFKVSKDASQSLASPSLLDEARTDINLFLGVELPEVLDVIEARFRKSSASWIAVPKAAIQKENYLNSPRLARILILALARLLWSLSHQVELKNGQPSATRRCFERCSYAQIFINSILNVSKPPCLANVTKDDKCLINFIRSADDLVKDLRHAYATEQLHELNMEDLTNSAYQSLDILTKGLFTLLYRRHDSNEKKYLPDEMAADSIKKDLASLKRILKSDDSRLDVFRERAHLVPDVDFLNKKATTLIDVLIIFCHLSYANRKALITELNARRGGEGYEVEWAAQLARRLKIFEQRFITPVEYPGEVYKDSAEPFNPHSFFSRTITPHDAQNKSSLAGKRLIPFLTLLMATRFPTSYVLSGEALARSEDSGEHYLDPNIDMHRTGWQQLQAINEQAKQQAKKDNNKDNNKDSMEKSAYFSCSMSSFMYASEEANPQLEILPEMHDRMRDLAQLLDLVFKMHRQLSKNQIFHDFFIECLDWVKDEYTRLGQDIATLKTEDKNGVDRYIQEILLPMDLDLMKNFKEIQRAMKDSKRIVTGAKFMEKIEENSAKDIETIHKLVNKLFNKDTKLLALIARRSNQTTHINGLMQQTTPSSMSRCSSNEHKTLQKYALQELMEKSYSSMSYISRVFSKKGPLLSALMAELSLKRELTDQDVHDYLEKLIRIAASYRKTSFFPLAQAEYAETETMRKAIIPAIKNIRINSVLPFSSVVFGGQKLNLNLMSDEKIIKALKTRCVDNNWERSEDEMSEENFLGLSSQVSPDDLEKRLIKFRQKEQKRSLNNNPQPHLGTSSDSPTTGTLSASPNESKDSIT